MAARKRKVALTETWKEKIQVSVIGLRLYDHLQGKNDMTNTQIKAAEILLRKLVPDLNKVEGAGENGEHVFQVVAPWLKQAIERRN